MSMRMSSLVLALITAGCGGSHSSEPSQPRPTQGTSEASAAVPAVAGIVTGPDGRPVLNALVCAYSRSAYGIEAHARTDPNGRWTLPLAPGRYRVSVTAKGLTAAMSSAFAHGEIDDGGDPRLDGDLTLAMGSASAGGVLRGRLTLPAGVTDELPLIKLHASSNYNHEPYCAELGADGVFSALVPAGGYFVDVLSPDKSWFLDYHRYDVVANQPTEARQRLFSKAELTVPASDAVIAGLRKHALPLSTAAPGQGLGDLAGLDETVRGARVVALGEASHGTREFFQIKHRMLEYLVEKHGFDVFAIEAIFSESLAVNEYVLHGKGSAAEALTGMYFWVWDTEEVIALIEWMRAYNANPNHARKLRFYGIDMQFTPAASRELRAYFERVGAAEASQHEELWKALHQKGWGRTYMKSDAAHVAYVRATLESWVAGFADNRAAWIAKTGARELAFARQHLEILRQAESQFRPNSESFNARDKAMADNVMWLLNNEPAGTKVVLWAHNRHIEEAGKGVQFTGSHLARALGDAYVSFGFTFNQGSFQARDTTLPKPMGVTEVALGPEPDGFVGHTFARVGHPIFALDLRRAIAEPAVAKWFSMPRFARELGAVFTGEAGITYGLRYTEDFDALFFVDNTTRARPTETGKRGPGE